jgi:CDP-6-deoxy-D-xylo-4-hexulose-3-dehydrase
MFGGNLILQPAYENKNLIFSENLTNADNIANNSFWLGIYPGLGKESLDYIYDCTKIFIERS